MRRVRFMAINLSETFPIVDHQLSNTTLCVIAMISGWFYTLPNRTIEYSSFIRSFLHRKCCAGCETVVVCCRHCHSQLSQELFCHWLCFLWYSKFFASNKVCMVVWLYVWRPSDISKRKIIIHLALPSYQQFLLSTPWVFGKVIVWHKWF